MVIRDEGIRWHQVAQDEVNRPFSAAAGPLVRAVALTGAADTTVILTFHHSVADGLAALFIMHEILVALSGGNFHDMPPADLLEQRLGMQLPQFLQNTPRDDHDHSGTSSDLSEAEEPKAVVTAVDLENDLSERLFFSLGPKARRSIPC